MKRARWQKLTGFALALVVAAYAVHVAPASASTVVVAGVVPLFVTLVSGNVAEHKATVAKASGGTP